MKRIERERGGEKLGRGEKLEGKERDHPFVLLSLLIEFK